MFYVKSVHFERKFSVFSEYNLEDKKKCLPLHSQSRTTHCRNDGAIAQLVEQRTENPCVPGSIPGGTTIDSVISQNPLKFSHFNGFSFILQYANSSRFEYLEMSHSVAFLESL